MSTPRIGVVLVTRNSSNWLAALLESIGTQTLQPTKVLMVDDHSTDDTAAILEEWSLGMNESGVATEIVTSTCTDQHPWTRIARNFTQGARALKGFDLVALADHDDEWLPNRLAVQSRIMRDEQLAFLASSGLVERTSDTLFDSFEVPAAFGEWDARRKLRHVLRHSVATGAASMLRPSALVGSSRFVPPHGWLHDRWWSILAAAHAGLQVSDEPVIRYRISEEQSVGLNRGRQTIRGLTRLRTMGTSDVARLMAVHSLKAEAAPELRMELSWGRLLKTLL